MPRSYQCSSLARGGVTPRSAPAGLVPLANMCACSQFGASSRVVMASLADQRPAEMHSQDMPRHGAAGVQYMATEARYSGAGLLAVSRDHHLHVPVLICPHFSVY